MHTARTIVADLDRLQRQYRVFVYYLPAYSPGKQISGPANCTELNPVELIFARLKNNLRAAIAHGRLLDALVQELAKVTVADIRKLFGHCDVVSRPRY